MGTLLEAPTAAGAPGGAKFTDITFDLNEPSFQSDHFRMYDFKVKRCPRARPHDWTACPFAHPGEKAKRRDPRRYRYSGTACPDFRKTGVCRRGDACPYSHGVFECWLHPSRYRTQMCTDGPSCRRRVCFFAHYEHELRRAEEYPPLLNQALHAGLVADARALQQQQLAQALSGILGSSAPALPGGTPAGLEPLMNVQLLKTLSQQTPASLLPSDSAPATPTGLSALSPTTTLGGSGGSNAGAQLPGSSKLLLQLQLMQQQQQQQGQAGSGASALTALHHTVSDASQHSGSSPGGSPRYLSGPADVLTPTAADSARQGSPPLMLPTDDASQLARLIQQQQQQQQAAAAAAAAGGLDPALLAALQSMGLTAAQPNMQEGFDAAGLGMSLAAASRRSIDNGALARPSAADNYLAAAAAALASGTAVGCLGAPTAVPTPPAAAPTPATLLNTTTGGSLPTQSFMAAAAAALQGAGALGHAPAGGQPGAVMDDDRTLSLDHILAELPRSASQVNLPPQ